MKILLRAVKITAFVLVVCMVVGLISVLAINGRVVSLGKERLLTAQ